jgi:hypothetical protein
MLKEILFISGRSGLYKLISKGKNMFIVESLIDPQRIPIYMRDKVVSLGDISLCTKTEDVPLYKVLAKIKAKENGKEIEYNPSTIQADQLRAYLETILPDFDKGKVYPSDIKKLMSWYNLLVKSDLTDFEDEKDEEGEKEKNTGEEKNTNDENIEN